MNPSPYKGGIIYQHSAALQVAARVLCNINIYAFMCIESSQFYEKQKHTAVNFYSQSDLMYTGNII